MKRSSWFWQLLAITLVAAAIARELSKPADERTWEGSLLGFIPYDLRLPTLDRIRERLWNPNDERILVPTVFGVGWVFNLAPVAKRLSGS